MIDFCSGEIVMWIFEETTECFIDLLRHTLDAFPGSFLEPAHAVVVYTLHNWYN